MPERETRHLTVTMDGQDRDGTWEEGGGVYVEGSATGKNDTVLIEGTPYGVAEMRRLQAKGQMLTLESPTTEHRSSLLL